MSAWLRGFASSNIANDLSPRDGERSVLCRKCGQWGIPWDSPHPPRIYWEGQRLVIAGLLNSSTNVVLEDEGRLTGFACFREKPVAVVHWVYVVRSSRGAGLARRMLTQLTCVGGVRYTHRTPRIRDARLPSGWVYDPYQVYWQLMATGEPYADNR